MGCEGLHNVGMCSLLGMVCIICMLQRGGGGGGLMVPALGDNA